MPLDRAKIKRLRRTANLSLAAAAGGAGMRHRQNWANIEAGRQDVTVSQLEAIADVLGVTPAELLVPKRRK